MLKIAKLLDKHKILPIPWLQRRFLDDDDNFDRFLRFYHTIRRFVRDRKIPEMLKKIFHRVLE